MPSARHTPYPGGGEVPRRNLRLWDPVTALAMVAARTNLIVGTCVSLPGEHDPIAYAKAIATLDVNSGGRFVFGDAGRQRLFGGGPQQRGAGGGRPEWTLAACAEGTCRALGGWWSNPLHAT
jgi:Luciferase-like monooxygenase